MIRALVLAGALALPAHAETIHAWGYFPEYQSTITLQPTQAPGAVAEVRFVNKTVHMDEVVTFTLDLDGLAVVVVAQVGRGMTPDRMTVTPPDGFIAVPDVIDVAEDQAGVVLILPYIGF
jgi:hypothetical protein